MRQFLIRISEALDTIGFALIVGAVVYFIIGNVVVVVHGHMLDWTFCGSAHYLAGVEWCGVTGDTDEPFMNHFIHHLVNATLPWFAMFWGVVMVAFSSLMLKILEYRYR